MFNDNLRVFGKLAFDRDFKVCLRRTFRDNRDSRLAAQLQAKFQIQFLNLRPAKVLERTDRILSISPNRLVDVLHFGDRIFSHAIGLAIVLLNCPRRRQHRR